MARLLNKLLKKGTPDNLHLDEERGYAFHSLINEVCSPHVLSLPTVDPSFNFCYRYSTDTQTCTAYGQLISQYLQFDTHIYTYK